MHELDKNEKSAFWLHLEGWASQITHKRDVEWQKQWLKNEYCAQCRYCCGPQGADEPFPMPLLPRQLGPDNKANFYMLDKNTAYIGAEGCKSDTATGCRLTLAQKPVACNLFPIVLIKGKLYLYQTCPAVLALPLGAFLQIALQAAQMLDTFTLQELQHLSIDVPCEILSEKYINLHIQLFDETGKKLLLK